MTIQNLLFPFQKCPKDWERIKDQREAHDVRDVIYFYVALAPYSCHCFVELSDVTYCNEGIAKYKKILNMIGELSTITIFRICPHLVNYSTSMQIILRHILLVNLAARWGGHF